MSLFQFLLGPANTALSGLGLLGILDPADEFVARQGRDVVPRREGCGVGNQGRSQVGRQLVHHPAGDPLIAHRPTVAADSKAVRDASADQTQPVTTFRW